MDYCSPRAISSVLASVPACSSQESEIRARRSASIEISCVRSFMGGTPLCAVYKSRRNSGKDLERIGILPGVEGSYIAPVRHTEDWFWAVRINSGGGGSFSGDYGVVRIVNDSG